MEFANIVFDLIKTNETLVREILDKVDKDQNTLLHLAILKGHVSTFEDLFMKTYVEGALEICNKDGDTPLHLALRSHCFPFAQKLIEMALTVDASFNEKILSILNKSYETPGGLIGSEEHLTKEFEDFFWKKLELVQAMMGVRSLSGLPTELIKDYTGTIGVTAALPATITFTAGFTVPGGLNSNNGSLLLPRDMAFQAFMVLDMIAMCLSMMVLIFLIWIMTIGNKKHQVVLLDISVLLLKASFHTTLLTFMMGLFATVYRIKLWIAILDLVLCSSLVFFMNKRLMTRFIPWCIWLYVKLQRAYFPVRVSCKRLPCGEDPSRANVDQAGATLQGDASQSIPEENNDSNRANEQAGSTSQSFPAINVDSNRGY